MKRYHEYSWRFAKAVFNSLPRDARRNEVLEELLGTGPRAVFGGLLWHAQSKNYNPGWAAHAFKEIFGIWPRQEDRTEAATLPGDLIEQWAAQRKPSTKIRKQKPAPLVDRMSAPEVDENGFVQGTLTRPEDFDVKFEVGSKHEIPADLTIPEFLRR